jgi:hypothetical protein
MSADAKKSYGLSCTLLLFGLIAVYGGAQWLLILIPAALLIWFTCPGRFNSTRNLTRNGR